MTIPKSRISAKTIESKLLGASASFTPSSSVKAHICKHFPKRRNSFILQWRKAEIPLRKKRNHTHGQLYEASSPASTSRYNSSSSWYNNNGSRISFISRRSWAKKIQAVQNARNRGSSKSKPLKKWTKNARKSKKLTTNPRNWSAQGPFAATQKWCINQKSHPPMNTRRELV